jgi:hypothetical protein
MQIRLNTSYGTLTYYDTEDSTYIIINIQDQDYLFELDEFKSIVNTIFTCQSVMEWSFSYRKDENKPIITISSKMDGSIRKISFDEYTADGNSLVRDFVIILKLIEHYLDEETIGLQGIILECPLSKR